MAFGTQEETDEVMNEINMTPLVDVMLVLLIVFIITVPVMKHAVQIDLPRASNVRQSEAPASVRLSIAADGRYFWNEAPVDADQLPALMQAQAARQPQPQLQIRGDRQARYEPIAQAMAAAQRAGLQRIAFVTEPRQP